MNILEELKTRFPFYLMGKSPKVTEAAIYYLENDVSQWVASKKFGCSECAVRERAIEIRKMLNLPEKVKYGSCLLCGFKVVISEKTHFNIVDSKTNRLVARICSQCMKKKGRVTI